MRPSKSKSKSRNTHTPNYKTVRIKVPAPVYVPPIVLARPPSYAPKKTKRIQLKKPSRLINRTVKVITPPTLINQRDQKVTIDRGRLNVHNHRNTRKTLQKEANRRRKEERKYRKRKRTDGQIGSVRKDKKGLLAANKGNWESLNNAALVSRALGWS